MKTFNQAIRLLKTMKTTTEAQQTGRQIKHKPTTFNYSNLDVHF
jgi:hypothetical protein